MGVSSVGTPLEAYPRHKDLFTGRVRTMARIMVDGQDLERLAIYFQVSPHTFQAKVNKGRFSAWELLLLAEICGFDLKLKPKNFESKRTV